MASEVDVVNMALSHFGSETVVTSISPPDGSVEAGHAKRFFAHARKVLLEQCTASWAKKRATLAEVTNPSSVWAYAYALPSDCLLPRRVIQQMYVPMWAWWPNGSMIVSADEIAIFNERGSANFEVEDGTLLTNEPTAVLLYTRDIPDLTKWNTTAIDALSYMLASYMAGPLVKGKEGVDAATRLRSAAVDILNTAAMRDANASAESAEFIPSHLAVR